ncbi:MAG: hypothetical protein PHS34_09045 [Candidatus Omnitrophica bacterium]|nr:hypothetical protein [Candidatus Omnitrophota bacterium]
MEELRKEKLRKETLDEITADWASQNQIEQPSYAFYLQTRLVNALLKQKLSKQVTEEEFKKFAWAHYSSVSNLVKDIYSHYILIPIEEGK